MWPVLLITIHTRTHTLSTTTTLSSGTVAGVIDLTLWDVTGSAGSIVGSRHQVVHKEGSLHSALAIISFHFFLLFFCYR